MSGVTGCANTDTSGCDPVTSATAPYDWMSSPLSPKSTELVGDGCCGAGAVGVVSWAWVVVSSGVVVVVAAAKSAVVAAASGVGVAAGVVGVGAPNRAFGVTAPSGVSDSPNAVRSAMAVIAGLSNGGAAVSAAAAVPRAAMAACVAAALVAAALAWSSAAAAAFDVRTTPLRYGLRIA
jgi:hypothetical protein